jgi:hypothetical protein
VCPRGDGQRIERAQLAREVGIERLRERLFDLLRRQRAGAVVLRQQPHHARLIGLVVERAQGAIAARDQQQPTER